VAAYVLDDTAPPPDLRRAFDYRAWGVDLYQLPPGEVRRINRAMNTYNTLTAYKRAGAKGETAEWSKNNPEAWEQVSAILAERMKRRKGVSHG